MITYHEFGLEQFDKLKEIYGKEGWSAYLHDEIPNHITYLRYREERVADGIKARI